MGSLGLNFLILLHALNWGNEPLISNNAAKYHRSILMNSLELPKALKLWSKKSEAVWRSLLLTMLPNSSIPRSTLVEKLHCDGEDLSEKTFLSITPWSITLLLKLEVPTL